MIHTKILLINKQSEECEEYRQALKKGKKTCNGITLTEASVRDGVLYRKNLLWVPTDSSLLVDLIREAHDPPTCGHPGVHRTVELLQR